MTLKHLITPTERIPKLKNLILRKGFVKAIEVHNGLSGLIANDIKIETNNGILEFDALWESSLTDSASKGLPDIELVSMDSRLATTEQIARVTDKPIIFDGDTGGDASHFEYLIPRLENIGVSAVIIEDKVFPKRNSLSDDARQVLDDPKIFANKIKAGKNVQKSKDFMIITRIESLIAGESVEKAIKRAEIYINAGADGIMIHSSSESHDKIKEFADKYQSICGAMGVKVPLVSVPTTYNTIKDSDLKEFGFSIVIHANHQLRASYQAMEEVCRLILLNDRSFEANSSCVPVKKIFDKVGFDEIKEKDKMRNRQPPVVIPAAGYDSLPGRLNQGNIPKSLININGKTFLERQINMLNKMGLSDINVIIGYQSDKFNIKNVNYILNRNWKEGYITQGIALSKEKIKEGFILINADMLFEEEVIKRLLSAEGDIVVIADSSYAYHKHEVDKVLDLLIAKEPGFSRLREIKLNSSHEIKRIGKRIDINEATHETLSVVKFSEEGAKNFIKVYEDCLQHHKGPFHEAESVQKADFTDVLQEMIYRGFKVNFIETHKGWLELHNEKDYELISNYFKNIEN